MVSKIPADGQLLRDVGLDFTFLLSTLLQPPSTSTSSVPTFAFPEPTPAPGHYDPSTPFAGYTIPQTPADELNMARGGTSPSDVLQDYAYGYEDEDDPPKSARSTAPLAINRRAKGEGPGGSRGRYGDESLGGRKVSETRTQKGSYEDDDGDLR